MRTFGKIVLTALPLAFVASQAGSDTFVRMLSGPSGGSWYPYGAKMMDLVGKNVKGVSASNGPGGGVGNVRDINKGNAELGWTFGNTAYDGYMGRGKFKKKLTFLRTKAEQEKYVRLIQEAKDNPNKPPIEDEPDRAGVD